MVFIFRGEKSMDFWGILCYTYKVCIDTDMNLENK